MTDQTTRREFLNKASELLAMLIALILAVPLLGFSLATIFQRRKSNWVRLGPVSEVKRGEPTRFVYSFLKEDAYLQKVERGTVYVITHDGRHFKVLSNICTHAGCGVRWEKKAGAFLCPCHDGRFDINGRVIAGPPPRPLDEIEHKIEGGFIFIKMEV